MKVGQPGPIDSSPYFLVARYYETRRNGLQRHRDKSARVERAWVPHLDDVPIGIAIEAGGDKVAAADGSARAKRCWVECSGLVDWAVAEVPNAPGW